MNPINVAGIFYFAAGIGLIVEVGDASAVSRENQSIRSSETSGIHQTGSATQPAQEKHYSELVDRVHQQVNDFRREHGLKLLRLDPTISAEAREHSAEMARSGNTISHRGFKQRLQDIRKKIPSRAAAENVAASVGYDNPARTAVDGWKNSPEHRKNMLGDFSLTGIGIAQSKDGGYFFTQIFIEPMK
jgi:uncharacterized protein YkwD